MPIGRGTSKIHRKIGKDFVTGGALMLEALIQRHRILLLHSSTVCTAVGAASQEHGGSRCDIPSSSASRGHAAAALSAQHATNIKHVLGSTLQIIFSMNSTRYMICLYSEAPTSSSEAATDALASACDQWSRSPVVDTLPGGERGILTEQTPTPSDSCRSHYAD